MMVLHELGEREGVLGLLSERHVVSLESVYWG